jgi:hypothetical protein
MIHEAGILRDGVQACKRCGVLLSDYRGAMVLAGEPELKGFALGAHVKIVEQFGGKFSGVTAERVDCTDSRVASS